jgi:hypothetical protein
VLLGVRVPSTEVSVESPVDAPLTVQARRYASDWTGLARLDVAPRTSMPVGFPPDTGSEPWQVGVAGEAARICSLRGS